MRSCLVLCVMTLATGGCARVTPERGHDRVAALVEQRTGQRTGWQAGPPDDGRVSAWVRATVAQGLTRARAVEIALVNSPELGAAYEELGISQADMVQAGLLRNPTFGAEIGVPVEHGQLSEQRFSLVQDFLDLFVLPARKRIAREQFEADTLRVAGRALEVAAEAHKAFVTAQAAGELVGLRRAVVDGERAAADLAARQFEAGNISALELSTQRATYEQARLDLAQDELDEVEARERLDRLLGLSGETTRWRIAEALPPLPAGEVSFQDLEALAMRQRLDIASARTQAGLLARAVALARSTRLLGRLEIGVDTHRDPDGPRVLGPNLVVELPLFDQRQATIARLEAQRRQQERRLAGLMVEASSEVRLCQARLQTIRQMAVQYHDNVLPLRKTAVEQAVLHYNGMFIGPYQLLAAKQAEVEAQRRYLEVRRNYWIARADLERAVGGALPVVKR
jgi:cobalt-zinc-cadmium efflux system outer membrane protein